MKFVLKKYLVLFTIFSIIFLISCKETVEEKSVQIEKTFTFETSFKPEKDFNGLGADLTDALNGALMNVAQDSKQDSVMQFQSKRENLSAIYSDIVFLPVLNADDLDDIINDHIDKSLKLYKTKDYSSEIKSIDFNKNFIVIVAHPKKKFDISSSEINDIGSNYIDKILDKGVKNNKYVIKLKSGRLRDLSSDLELLVKKWESDVYVLEKKNVDTLRLEFNDKIFNYNIKNKI